MAAEAQRRHTADPDEEALTGPRTAILARLQQDFEQRGPWDDALATITSGPAGVLAGE